MIFRSTYSKPVLLVGNGVRTASAVEMVRLFAREKNIPLLTTMNAVDIAQDDLRIGFIGTHGNRIANMILDECDLVISVGARLGIRQVGQDTSNFAPKADLVRNDIDEFELSRNIKTNERKYHADARDFMRILMEEDIPDFSEWKNKCLEAKKILDVFDKQPGNLAIEKISSLLPENPIVTVDVGMHQCWCTQSITMRGDNGRLLVSGGFGIMGCALPYAIGASISSDSGKTFCIAGDGGFQMNIQELEVLKRENLPVKIFILNNRVLGKISETQHFNHGDRFANTAISGGYTVPDFVKISEAYGIKAAKIEKIDDLSLYKTWIADENPCLFDISLPEESFLTPKIKFETGVISPKLDDEVAEKVQAVLT